eukprot:796806-Amphidinium_carterae.1
MSLKIVLVRHETSRGLSWPPTCAEVLANMAAATNEGSMMVGQRGEITVQLDILTRGVQGGSSGGGPPGGGPPAGGMPGGGPPGMPG